MKPANGPREGVSPKLGQRIAREARAAFSVAEALPPRGVADATLPSA
jgi:hypothetical protein